MITAIILARCNSSRLPRKHFYKIGSTKIINLIINNLHKNKLITKIYIGTGTKKNNFLFKNEINKENKKKCEVYFHKNEDDVTGRIYEITKKIKTKYTILISGDCCLVDNDFISRLYKQLKNTEYDFLKCKKRLIHEGVSLFRNTTWKKVTENSHKNYQKEHPGYVVNEFPELFKIGFFKPKNYEINKKFRLSVDTESDLDFFNSHYEYLKNKNLKFNLKNVLKSKNFNYLNNHVSQKKAIKEKEKKYIILTAYSKNIGLGHLARSKIIFREINEVITSNIKIFCIGKKFDDKNFLYNERIYFIKKINNSIFDEKHQFIIDLPIKEISKINQNKLDKKNITIIDNDLNLENPKFLIPSIRKIKHKKNLYSGKDYLILPRKALLLQKKKKENNGKFLLLSGSSILNKQIIDILKLRKLNLIAGPLLSNQEKKFLQKMKINYIFNQKDFLKTIKNSNEIYTKFGVSTYELIAIGKKPIIIVENESGERLKDIDYLYKIGMVKLFKNNKILTKPKKNKLDINNCLNNLINIIK